MILPLARLAVRRSSRALLLLVLAEAASAGWVGWYLVEGRWATASLLASPTPLAGWTFAGAWLTATTVVLAAGPWLGAAAIRGGWRGGDPTAVLPIDPAIRAASAWLGAAAILLVASLGPLPVYLALYELGAFRFGEIGGPLLVHLIAVALSPVPGIALASRRRWPR